jgi:hypothetical protein
VQEIEDVSYLKRLRCMKERKIAPAKDNKKAHTTLNLVLYASSQLEYMECAQGVQ